MWRPVKGFEGLYEIAEDGRVRNARTGYVLKPRKDKDGYLLLCLWIGSPTKKVTVKVHREVAKAFLPNPLGLPEVNHLDGDRANPALCNLQWASTSMNHLHAYRELGRVGPCRKAVVACKGEERRIYDSLSAAARDGFSRRGIQYCLNGEWLSHGGFTWSLANG